MCPWSYIYRLNVLQTSINRAHGNLIPAEVAENLLLSVEELREYARGKEQASAGIEGACEILLACGILLYMSTKPKITLGFLFDSIIYKYQPLTYSTVNKQRSPGAL